MTDMENQKLINAHEDQISQSIVDNYVISWREIIGVFSQPDPLELFNIHGFISGVPYMMMNSIFDGPEGMTLDDVSQIIQYFKDKKLPMMWFLSPVGIKYGIDILLSRLGIEEAKMQVPGMAVDLLKLEKNILENRKSKHNITRIEEGGSIESYTHIFMESFEIDKTIKAAMEKFSTHYAKYSNASHFLAKIDEHFVAIASVVYGGGVAGIYNVATLPEYRGKGLANALMSSCMLDAIDRGYQYSILHSSSMGHSVYEKLGYRDYFVFKRFLLRPSDVGLT